MKSKKSINKSTIMKNLSRNQKNKKSKKLSFRLTKRWLVLVVIVTIGAIGSGYLYFAKAQPNNCNKQDGVDICDVDMVQGRNDTILSTGPEATALNEQNPTEWNFLMQKMFRVPMSPINGAVPIHRVINVGASWHDWVTDGQKQAKEAKYGALAYEGVVFYAWDHQVPGTVPVYRLTNTNGTQAVFYPDKDMVDKLLAESANTPNGWRMGEVMESIAFYAYPRFYTPPNQVDPYDCSKIENLKTDRCKGVREALDKQDKAGQIPKQSGTTPDGKPVYECPKDAASYAKISMPGLLPADCQTYWNQYLRDCSKPDNFVTDRCKTVREEFAKAKAEAEKQKPPASNANPSAGTKTNTNTNINAGGSKPATAKVSAQQKLNEKMTSLSENCTAEKQADQGVAQFCRNAFIQLVDEKKKLTVVTKPRDCSVKDKTPDEVKWCTQLITDAMLANYIAQGKGPIINQDLRNDFLEKRNPPVEVGNCTISGIEFQDDMKWTNINKDDCIAIAKGVRQAMMKKKNVNKDAFVVSQIKSNINITSKVSYNIYSSLHDILLQKNAFNFTVNKSGEIVNKK